MLECLFAEFLYQGLPLSFKVQFLPQIEEGLCLAGCHVAAQTQGYHLVKIVVARIVPCNITFKHLIQFAR